MLHPNKPTADAIALGPRTPQGEARLKVTLRLWLVFGLGKPSQSLSRGRDRTLLYTNVL